jgi:hypothetical protein
MHAKNAELFIGFLGELCGIPLRTLRENFIPRKDRRGRCTQRPQCSLSNFFASFAKILCVLCVKTWPLAGVSSRKDRKDFSFNFLARHAKLLCAANKSNH